MDTDVSRQPHVRIALVCRAELLRLGVERVLAQEPAFTVRSYRLPDSVEGAFDVAVLFDRELADAARACAAARERLGAEIVLVSTRADPSAAMDCLAAGAVAVLTEDDTASGLNAAVLAAAAGRYHVGRNMLTALLDWQVGRRRRADTSEQAERALLRLLARGHTTGEIAAALGVSPKTVRNRSSLLYRRLGVRSRAQAVAVAGARGLLDQ